MLLRFSKTGWMLAGVLLLAACAKDNKKPGYVFMPDMTYSQAYETYSPNPFSVDSNTAFEPVANTVPRGYEPFGYENNLTGYARAGEELTNPLPATKENIAAGEQFYQLYCAICHGTSGEGNGKIVELQKFPPPPSYFNDYMLALPDGKMFFSVHYGRNLMGSYAAQLTKRERWQVIHYINKMQQDFMASQGGGESDTTAQ
jgi:mono/diheme cytochrome c family protein